MRRTQMISSVLVGVGLSLSAGCTLTVNDDVDGGNWYPTYPDARSTFDTFDAANETAVVWNSGAVGDALVTTPTPDSSVPEIVTLDSGAATEEIGTPAVIVRARDLIDMSLLSGGEAVDVSTVTDLGYGGTRTEILSNRLAYAVATVVEVSGVESEPFGRDDAGALQEVRLSGLPVGVPVTIKVTGYLRGSNRNGLIPISGVPVPWAEAECHATASSTADVVASCGTLKVLDSLAGVLITSDVLPPGFCLRRDTNTVRVRARTPESGLPVSTRSVECGGVLWFPADEFASAESTDGISTWTLTLENGSNICVRQQPCAVQRTEELPVRLIDGACPLSAATTTPQDCF